jgi:hypothetical protein
MIKAEAGQARIGKRRPEPGLPVIEPRGNGVDEQGGAGMEQRRRQPHGEFAIAENGGRQRDQPGDKRRL